MVPSWFLQHLQVTRWPSAGRRAPCGRSPSCQRWRDWCDFRPVPAAGQLWLRCHQCPCQRRRSLPSSSARPGNAGGETRWSHWKPRVLIDFTPKKLVRLVFIWFYWIFYDSDKSKKPTWELVYNMHHMHLVPPRFTLQKHSEDFRGIGRFPPQVTWSVWLTPRSFCHILGHVVLGAISNEGPAIQKVPAIQRFLRLVAGYGRTWHEWWGPQTWGVVKKMQKINKHADVHDVGAASL